MINKNIINKIKSLYNYPNLVNILKDRKIENLVNIYKKEINENQMDEFIYNLMMILPTEYIILFKNQNIENIKEIYNNELYKVMKNYYNNNKMLFYYDNIILIDEVLAKYIINLNNKIKKIIYEQSIECIIGIGKVLLISNNIINIGKFDNNYVFNTELIIQIYNQKKLYDIINQIKDFKLYELKTFIISDENNISKTSNSDFSIFKLYEENKNEILLNKINENEYLKKTAILKYQNKNTEQILEKRFFTTQNNKQEKEENQQFFNINNEELKKLILL